MVKLAIVDIDGVIADASARFARAEAIREAARNDRAIQLGERERTATDRYWRAALDPAYVYLDTLIEGVLDLIDDLANNHGYRILYLTSRPTIMREATIHWFEAHGVQVGSLPAPGIDWLVMKAPAFQYVKTPVWKAGMVHTLLDLFDVAPEDAIYIDDETAHHYEVQRHLPDVKCYASLQAVFAPPDEEGDPFLPDF